MTCYQTYLTSPDLADPQCMSCHRIFNREFLDSKFPRAWMYGAYRKARATILWDIERARLPDSQHLVANFRTAQTLTTRLVDLKTEKLNLKKRLRDIDVETWNSQNRLARIRHSDYQSDGLGTTTETPHRRDFVRGCPVDGCRGFLSTHLKCGVCETSACAQCLCVKDPDHHICNPDDVATAHTLKKETRPCPKCGISIFKIDGCDQMWCVSCKTPFSWKTGKIVVGVIHNPEYFRWMRERAPNGEIPRNDDNPCQRQDDIHELGIRLNRKVRDCGFRDHQHKSIMSQCRYIGHLQHVVIPRLVDPARPPDNSYLRLQYLNGSMSETEFQRRLVLQETRRDRELALRNVYEARCAATIDTFRAFLDDGETIDGTTTILEELRAIEEFSIDALARISRRFKIQVDFGPGVAPPC